MLTERESIEVKRLSSGRINLPRDIVKRMTQLGICTSPYLIESFKRWYLWGCFQVETSKALDAEGLEIARIKLKHISRKEALIGLAKKYNQLSEDRNVLRATSAQVNKIKAIAVYKFHLNNKDIKRYVEKTIDRKVYLYDITVAEAHHTIERLEKWEKKVRKQGNVHA